ncbi:MAG: class II glutamine amidotransferase [Eubacteriales bacterium]|nr:class II glutamine amidotransferase [Eubacteriales bacterium]
MCELFGVSSNKKIPLNALLKEFFSHGNEHPHGWGLAFFYGNSVSLEKQPEMSCTSSYLKQRLWAPVEADNMIAHIRLATRGITEYENCHPFVIRDKSDRAWTLAHNGTIFDCDEMNPYCKTQRGQTDSERILCYLVDCINQKLDELGREMTAEERFDLVDSFVCRVSPENKLNLLLYDGELMYVHTNYANSLHQCTKDETVIISTQPLNFDQWEPVPMNTLLAYRNGKPVFRGTNHGHEFFDSEEKMRLLFLDFSAL